MGETIGVLSNWVFRTAGEGEWRPAVVPGCVHTDLLRNGMIADPFYATNEHDLQWIDKKDWEYEASFDVSAELLGASVLELVFDGLDTYADVTVNGQHLLSADNMFRSWRADVKPLVKANGNKVHIRFRSPVQEDLPKLEALGYPLPAANDQSELGGLGERKISIFARKAPYHYGWDWGPRFVTSGIWREARLEGWSGLKISDVYMHQNSVSAEEAQLHAAVEIYAEKEWSGVLRLSADGQTWEQSETLRPGHNVALVPVVIKSPKLWWCRGLGEPNMYTFTAELIQEGQEQAGAQSSVRTGLRTAKLVRDKDAGGNGATFHFELNGVPVFAKGANHIPNDSFLTDVTEERYRHEIMTAVASNMNMLRVWGGGIYEHPAFYRLCDENGLLVWQDFMFACSMYPGDEAFLNNVRLEAAENVKRLRNHPCIALWCGNNEIDSAWANYDEGAGWGWKHQYEPEIREKIWADYEEIFHRILPDAVSAYAPTTDYWPSSPLVSLSGGREQHAHPLTTEGDVHYWGVWHNVEPFENYNKKIGRFMSEYGFQSFPEYRTVRAFAEETELRIDSKVMLAHQKNGDGNRLIKQYMDIYMSEPKDFPSFLYMSQVLQAEAMKTAIEAHRRKKPYCMGSLYWQMNDCWPVASWAGMDYYGRWKALQYYTRRSFDDTLLSFERTDGGRIEIHLVTDRLEPIQGQLNVKLFDFGGTLLKEQASEAFVNGNGTAIVMSLREEDWLTGYDAGEVVLYAELIAAGCEAISGEYYFAAAKELNLQPCAIKLTEAAGSGGARFVLETDRLAKQVRLTAEHDGIFSDNYFDLIPGRPKVVAFLSREEGEAEFKPAFPGKLEAHSMIDFLASSSIEIV